MFFLESPSSSPFFNSALEEYVFKSHKDKNFIIIYINSPSVLIGKHQNAYAEINRDFVTKNNITVVRRISGGGAVYHDLGNINFCFIQNIDNSSFIINFKNYLNPICTILKSIGLNPEMGSKNEILIDGYKISGNAEHTFKNRLLHHGTLLYSSNLKNLQNALNSKENLYGGNAVKSNRSRVENIASFLSKELNINTFKKNLTKGLFHEFKDVQKYKLTEADIGAVIKLAEEKYTGWDWNYAYSPEYTFKNQYQDANVDILVQLTAKNGLISEVSLNIHDRINKHTIETGSLEQMLIGNKHLESELLIGVSNFPEILNAISLSPKEFCTLFF